MKTYERGRDRDTDRERERGGREEIAKVRMSFAKSLRLRLRFLLA